MCVCVFQVGGVGRNFFQGERYSCAALLSVHSLSLRDRSMLCKRYSKPDHCATVRQEGQLPHAPQQPQPHGQMGCRTTFLMGMGSAVASLLSAHSLPPQPDRLSHNRTSMLDEIFHGDG